MSAWLRLEQNLILRAGAGTGKTHALISLALALLAGLRRGRPVEPHDLWLTTFTDLAAAELRQRLRLRLARLAASAEVAACEPELWEAASPEERRRLSPARFAALLERVAEVRAQTLHGAALAILREHGGPEVAGFSMLEPAAAEELRREVARQVVLDLPPGDAALALLEDFEFRGAGEFGEGLVESLASSAARLAEDGLEAPPAPPPTASASEWAAAGSEASLESIGAALRAAWAAAEGERTRDARLRGLAAAAAALSTASPESLMESWSALAPQAARLDHLQGPINQAAREAYDDVPAALGRLRALGHQAPFRLLLQEVRAGYRAAKQARGVLDFADLTNRARDLLRDDRSARQALKAQVGALLLDETQDTGRVQVELALLLCERRDTAAVLPVGRPLVAQLELEPGVFAAVGDRKQSIYEFRGANAAVFEELAAAVLRQGGVSQTLDRSRRSRPALVNFVNRFFAAALGPAEFSGDDALVAERLDGDLPAVTLLALPAAPELDPRPGQAAPERAALPAAQPPAKPAKQRAGDLRQREAALVAARAAALLARPPQALLSALPGGVLEPGHLAILFRTAAPIEDFRTALAAVGLPSVQLGGRGFFSRSEILDAAALLAVVADPADWAGGGIGPLTLLRSPLAAVSDAAIARLIFSRRRANERGLSLRWLWEQPPPPFTGAQDRAAMAELGAFVRQLRLAAPGLGASAILRRAEAAWGLRARYATAQASANLDKLEQLLAAWQGAGETLPAIVRRLRRQQRDDADAPQAPAVEEGDTRAVRLLTVHAAKGLEFPVVFVAGCGTTPRPHYPPALYVRDLGLSFKGRDPGGAWQQPADYLQVHAALQQREASQERRLFYVAATRARDLLYFSGELSQRAPGSVAGSVKGATWRQALDAHGAAAGLVVEQLDESPTPLPAGPLFGDAPPLGFALEQQIASALDRTAPLPRAVPLRLPLAASAAADLALCPRRYQLKQLWQVPEPSAGRARAEAESAGAMLPKELPAEDDPRALGSLAHRLLERVDLPQAAVDPEAAVAAAGARVAHPHERRELLEVGAEVRAVLASDFGQQLARQPAGRVRREVAFVLRLEGGGPPTLVLSGTIDLLAILEDRVVVIDYKRGPPSANASYDAQIKIYALAAEALTEGRLPIEAGLWFLRRGNRGPQLDGLSGLDLEKWRAELVAAARLVAGRDGRESRFPGREISYCEKISCGFLRRCHTVR